MNTINIKKSKCDVDRRFIGKRAMILPTDEDIDIIKTHFRGRDVAYNETKSYIDKERKQLSYIPKDVRDEYKIFPTSLFDVMAIVKDIVRSKPEYKEVPIDVIREGVADCYHAYEMYDDGNCKYPKYKRVGRTVCSCTYRAERMRKDDNTVSVTKLKDIKICHNTIPNKTQTSSSTENGIKYTDPTISFDGVNYWFSCCIKVPSVIYGGEIDFNTMEDEFNENNSLGIDPGSKHALTCSDGTIYDMPDTSRLENRIKRSNRSLSKKYYRPRINYSKRTGIPYDDIPKSKNMIKAEKKHKKLWNRYSNITKNAVHQHTADIIKKNKKVIVFEGTSVKDRNISHAKKHNKNNYIANSCRHRTFLCNKCRNNNIMFIIAKKYYPSTQRCHICGRIKRGKEKLGLYNRVYTCPNCGLSMDRDANAAKNMEALAYDPTLFKWIDTIYYGDYEYTVTDLPNDTRIMWDDC